MPELPEVETTVRGIRPALIERQITSTWLDWPASLVTPDVAIFHDRLVGQRVQAVSRRAKYIVIHLEADTLIVHLKMTGRLYVVPDSHQDHADQWVHFCFQLDNTHQLRFSDSRKFGRVYLVEDPSTIFNKLGPEPLEDDFSLAVFQQQLHQRKGRIKPILLDQRFVAGVGNIYADEALHRARIHPTRAADSLSADEQKALWESIRHVLAEGVMREGASVNWYRKPDGSKGNAQAGLQVYGQAGLLCQTCQTTTIVKIVIGQRGTHFCPNCQRENDYAR